MSYQISRVFLRILWNLSHLIFYREKKKYSYFHLFTTWATNTLRILTFPNVTGTNLHQNTFVLENNFFLSLNWIKNLKKWKLGIYINKKHPPVPLPVIKMSCSSPQLSTFRINQINSDQTLLQMTIKKV